MSPSFFVQILFYTLKPFIVIFIINYLCWSLSDPEFINIVKRFQFLTLTPIYLRFIPIFSSQL